MKKILVIAIALAIASCTSCNKQDEEFIPFPGGQGTKEQPRNQR